MNSIVSETVEENYIFFSIGSFNYAFNSKYVLDIMQLVELEYPESLPEYIAGLLEYNGKIIKIIDLRGILGLNISEYNLNCKIIVVKTAKDSFGIIIDSVKEIRKISAQFLNTPPYDVEKSYLKAIYTDGDFSATVINPESVEKKINSKVNRDFDIQKSASVFLPKDDNSKEVLHRRKLHYASKMRRVNYEIIKSKDTYITFLLDEITCYVRISRVAGFYKFENMNLAKIPCTPDFIIGVVNVKGRYITVIDLLKYSENKSSKITKNTSIIVIEYEDYQLGIIADAIGETVDIYDNLTKYKTEKTNNCLKECVIDDKMFMFLDVKMLFEDEKLYVS